MNGERLATGCFPSTVTRNVDPGTDEVNTSLIFRFVAPDLGDPVIVVWGSGQAAWASAETGQASWLTSPKPSWSASGSTTAAMSMSPVATGIRLTEDTPSR